MKTSLLPRILLGGTSSGSGKTTITCGLLKCLEKRGENPISFKCGPDYIDPMFHKNILGVKSRNLDLFFNTISDINNIMGNVVKEDSIGIMEGVMGFYDGLGGKTYRASSYELAKTTNTPVILVVDGRGKSYSILAEIKGYLELEEDNKIEGVLLNRISPMMYPVLKELIEERFEITVFGYLPLLKEGTLESRHLGLVTAAEVENLEEIMENLQMEMEKTVDIDKIIKLGEKAPSFDYEEEEEEEESLSVAIARDKAFCFYYDDNLELLKQQGIELIPFSPLEDEKLPENISGLILGGGYPELYLETLEKNKSMRGSIGCAISKGLPTLAECGGFMYLHQWIENDRGEKFQGVGTLEGGCYPTLKLQRFGYITLEAEKDNALCPKGETLKAHEFHYWESTDPGNTFSAKKPVGNRQWKAIIHKDNLYAGFPHINYRGNKEMVKRFKNLCLGYR